MGERAGRWFVRRRRRLAGRVRGGRAALGAADAPAGALPPPDFTAAQVTAFGISGSLFAGYLYLTVYLQTVLHLSPIETGLVYLPGTVTSFLVAGATASLGAKSSPRTLLVVGLTLAGAGLAVMVATLHAGSSWLAFEPGLVIGMAGVGLINPVLSGLALNSVDDANSGLAAGANDTFRQAGIAIGVAVLGALIPAHPATPGDFVDGLHVALLVAGCLCGVSAVVVARLLGMPSARAGVASGKAVSQPA